MELAEVPEKVNVPGPLLVRPAVAATMPLNSMALDRANVGVAVRLAGPKNSTVTGLDVAFLTSRLARVVQVRLFRAIAPGLPNTGFVSSVSSPTLPSMRRFADALARRVESRVRRMLIVPGARMTEVLLSAAT